MHIRTIATCAAFALTPVAASAASVSFTDCINQSACSVSADGAQLSISGTVNDTGGSAPFLSFSANEIGIGSGGFTNVFQFSFDADVTLNAFGIGNTVGAGPNTGFGIAGGTGGSAVSYFTDATTPNTTLTVTGGLSFAANTTYTLTAEGNNTNGTGSGYTAFLTWDVTAAAAPAVPLPASLPLLLAGMGVFAAMRRRAKA